MGRKRKEQAEKKIDFSKIDEKDIVVDASYYKGNENLLKNNAQIKWTPELIEEFETCTKNILHFSENYFFIHTNDEGKRKIELYKYQKKLLRAFRDNRFNIILSSRQSGKTTTITIYALWIVCFQADKRITIVANKESTAKEIFSRIRMAFEELPVWMKPSVKSWRKDGFQLGNDSEIKVATSSSSGPRGSTSNLLIIDEMAHCPNEIMQELWKSAIPIISASKKSQIVVISTPNGTDNKFYELYKESQKQNTSWHLETVNWFDVPGRDEEWKKEALSLLNNNMDDFEQEYCNKFHEPGKTAIDPELLKALQAQCKDPIYVMDDGAYRIYNPPSVDGIYVVGVDVGEGIGRSNTVAQILNIANLTNIEQVAVFASNSVSPYHFGTRLMGILQDWGRPPVLVENNNNGQQVLDVLHHAHNYESIVSYDIQGSKFYNKENRLGIYNHTNTKYKGITNFRYWSNSLNAVRYYDLDTLLELETFVKLPNFTFSKRKDTDRDDRVMSMIWALFILDPSVAEKYYAIGDFDDQGRPLKITPLINNTDLIKNSPLFEGKSFQFKRDTNNINANFSHVGSFDAQKLQTFNDEMDLKMWLMKWGEKQILKKEDSKTDEKVNIQETFYPVVF
jgi:hypothetical protein